MQEPESRMVHFPTQEATRYYKALSIIYSRGSGDQYPHPLPTYLWERWQKENEECSAAWKAWSAAMEKIL